MSIETWKKEFYPKKFIRNHFTTTAASEPTKEVTLEALNHSTQKWTGTTPENLAKHDVYFQQLKLFAIDESIDTTPCFSFNVNTCALCTLYFWDDCEGCPLNDINQGCLDEGSDYSKLTYSDPAYNTKDLIASLIRAKEEFLKKGKNEN